MNTKSLGLPLEYQELPIYFDALETNENNERNNNAIEHLLKEYKTHTVLDIACGTGSQVFYLAKRGYQVTGADFSPQLLTIAKEKTEKQKLSTTFIDGDMRALQVGCFDAVITIANAIGHLSKSDFETALRNIRGNLKDGGIYIFDILNALVMTDTVVASLAWHVHKKINDHTQFHQMQCSTFDSTINMLTGYDMIMIQKGAAKPEQYTNTCSIQLYTAQELDEMLVRNGFKVIKKCSIDGSAFVDNETLSMMTVVQKI